MPGVLGHDHLKGLHKFLGEERWQLFQFSQMFRRSWKKHRLRALELCLMVSDRFGPRLGYVVGFQ